MPHIISYVNIHFITQTDKNSDCDTSILFTVIQSAYELLYPTTPDILTTEENDLETNPNKSAKQPTTNIPKAKSRPQHTPSNPTSESQRTYESSNDNSNKYNTNQESKYSSEKTSFSADKGTNVPNYKNDFDENNQKSNSKPRTKKQQQRAQRCSSNNNNENKSDASTYPDATTMTTDELREIIRQFGVR